MAAYFIILMVALLVPADREWHAHRAAVWLSTGRDLPMRVIVTDGLVNILAFLPFGAVLYRRPRSLAGGLFQLGGVVGGAAAFSIAMETAQYLLAWRESSAL
ncbi:MAG TPA: hypothetical protein VFJ24_02550, partial [Gaiellales bacterium]|nr:hypothetical protein [Gaiellales bacterium]